MSKYINLTNATTGLEGTPFLLAKDAVVSAYNKQKKVIQPDGQQVERMVTYVFCPPHGTWEVQEDLATLHKLLDE
jgi:hypothetical protein